MPLQIGRSIGNLAGVIHGRRNSPRPWILNQFRQGRTPVLVATLVAARGRDVRIATWSLTTTSRTRPAKTVHNPSARTCTARSRRVGRTRGIDGREGNMARKLIPILRDANQVVPHEIEEMQADRRIRSLGVGRKGGGGAQRRRRRLRRRRLRAAAAAAALRRRRRLRRRCAPVVAATAAAVRPRLRAAAAAAAAATADAPDLAAEGKGSAGGGYGGGGG